MEKQYYIDLLKDLVDFGSEIFIKDGVTTGYKTYVFRKNLSGIMNKIHNSLEKNNLLKNVRTEKWTISAELVEPLDDLSRVEIHISKDR